MFNISKTCQINHTFYNELLTQTFGNNTGFFVDVGANDGLECSNTSCLICSGWDGIMIEPLPQEFKKCAALHSNCVGNVTIYNCGVSDKEETLKLFVNGGLSTFCQEGIPYNRVRKNNTISVQCYSLNQILEKEQVKHIDLLSIDVEGYEDKVLQGFNIEKYKPTIIIIELHAGTRPDNGKHSEFRNPVLIQRCKSKLINYERVYSDHINDIYIRKT